MLSLTYQLLSAKDPVGFFKNFNVRQGLPSARILHLHQDEKGYIWMATNNGISRFDGYSFLNFSNSLGDSTSLSGDYVYTITSDSSLLWVGHYEGGLDLFDISKGKVIRHWDEDDATNPIPDNRITKLWIEKGKNRIWVGTSKKHFVWIDLSTGVVTIPVLNQHKLNINPSPVRNSIYDVVPHQNILGLYWLATNEGLALYNEAEGSMRYFYPLEQVTGYNNFNRLRDIELIDNKLWIATRGDGGLLSFDTEALQWQSYELSDNKHNLSTRIIKKSDKELWIGTVNDNNAYMSYNIETKTIEKVLSNTALPYKLQSNVVFDLFKDRDDNIWIGTEKGLSLYTNKHQVFPTKPIKYKDLAKSTPLTFQAFQNKVYAGMSFSHGILEIEPVSGAQKLITPHITSERYGFIRMTISPKDELWVTGQSSLFKLSNDKTTLLQQNLPIKENKKLRYQSLYFLNDHTLLIGTRFNGLLVWDQKKNSCRFINTSNSDFVHDRFINEIIADRNGHLWISTERGISILDKNSLKIIKNYGLDQGFKMTYRLSLDSKGTIWASSENKGVYGFNTSTLKQDKSITKKDGLPSHAIQHIAADEADNLWISTQQGLCKYNLNDQSILIFTSESGLIDNHLEGSLNLIKGKQMALGFKGTYTLFNSDPFTSFQIKEPPRISEVKVLNETYFGPNTSRQLLDYYENSLSFEFSALNYAIPENLNYRYRLIGLNEKWSLSSNNIFSASYTNLSSGDYTFEVQYAVKGFKGWSLPAIYHFTINPPFWKTNWFYVLCLIAIGLVIRAFYNSKIRQIKSKEELKTAMSKEFSTLEMKALRSQMNPHFIFNSLNSIKYYVIQNETNKASKYLNDFSRLIRRIFNNTQSEFSILEEEIETLKLFLQLEKLRFGDKMSFQFDIDPNLELPFIKVPNMLIQPFIENSVWHGLMHKPEGGTIIVRFQMLENNYLQVEIHDDGVGREEAKKRNSITIDHKSKGILLTQKRIELINENLDMDISLDIKDLYEGPVATGTLVSLKMKILDT